MSLPESSPVGNELPPDLFALAADALASASPEARAQLLDRLSQEHPAHAVSLRQLAADLFGVSRLLDAGFADPSEPAATEAPSRIGEYRVQRVLGEGAFGIVYLCTQAAPVHREVAVKLLRPGAGDRRTLERFEAERQFLARQNHPSITQVFDAGTLPDGRPWFVMEYVRGLPITKFCDQQELSVEARVALFQRLCHGVQHAHAHGIVHRDLKPANVLIVLVDGEPQPKIIDFGIAKALEQSHLAGPIATETGRVIGTPGYMSPEQAAGQRGTVDARADVFSLGVMLYELLTGELPWGRRPETTDSEPPRPSVRVATGSAGATTVASRRSSQPRQLASTLRGDLDWIVLKALARERERRYPSALELAADLERHLRGQPVLAGPPSPGYRLRKAMRRHRVAFVGAAGVLLALALGAGSTWHYRGEVAARELDAAGAVARLVVRANDPALRSAPNNAPLRRALLQDALDLYDRFLRTRPRDLRQQSERANTLFQLATVHLSLGECPRAIATAREAVEASRAVQSSDPAEPKYRGMLGRAHSVLGGALNNAGEVAAARQEMRQAIALLESCVAETPEVTSILAGTLFDLYQTLDLETEAGVAADLLNRARLVQAQLVERRPDANEPKAGMVKIELGRLDLHMTQNEIAAAEIDLENAKRMLATIVPADLYWTVLVDHAAARLASLEENHAVAIEHLQLGIAAGTRLRDRDPSQRMPLLELAAMYSTLAGEQHMVGDLAARDASFHAAIETVQAHVERFPQLFAERGTLAKWLGNYAYGLLAYGRRSKLPEAEASARRSLEVLASLPAAFDGKERQLLHWTTLGRLGLILDAAGRTDARLWDETEQAMAAWAARYGVVVDGAFAFAEASVRIARHHFAAGRTAEATHGLDRLTVTLGESLRTDADLQLSVVEALRLRAAIAAQLGDPAAAAEAVQQILSGPADWHAWLAAADGLRRAHGAAQLAGEPAARAEAYAAQAIEQYRAAIAALEPLVAASPQDLWSVLPLGQARLHLAGLLRESGEQALAAALVPSAVDALRAARDEAFVDAWDEELFVKGCRW